MAEDGEEWKGEPERPPGGFFASLLGGYTVTPEQRRAYEAQLASATAIGDATWDGVATYDPARSCPMCGCAKHKLVYLGDRSGCDEVCARHAGTHAHLHQTCKRCAYVLIVRPLRETA